MKIAWYKKANYMAGNSEGHFDLLGETEMNDTDNQQKRLMDIGWLVGILEGEGCFSLQRTNNGPHKGNGMVSSRVSFSPLVQFTNTNPYIITEIQRIIKDLGLTCYTYFQKQNGYRMCFRVVIMGIKRAKTFLDFILPHIRCRREQAEIVLDYCNLRLARAKGTPVTDEELALHDRLQRLNRPYLFPETARLLLPEQMKVQGVKIQSALHGDMQAAQAAVANSN